MTNGKCSLLACSLVLLLVGPLSSAYSKPAYGTAAQLLQEWKQRIETLSADLEAYKAQLIASQQDLEALQTRLGILQTDLEKSSSDLTISIESSASFSVSLNELRKSLQAQSLARNRIHLREKIEIGVIAAIVGALLGGLTVAFIK